VYVIIYSYLAPFAGHFVCKQTIELKQTVPHFGNKLVIKIIEIELNCERLKSIEIGGI